MKATHLSLLPVGLLVIFSFVGCGKKETASAIGAPGPVKIKFQTDWYPQPEHGGYYQALARGFYAEEGLDVEILPGGPNAQVMTSVAVGRADLGMTNGDDVIVAIARGVPIKMVAMSHSLANAFRPRDWPEKTSSRHHLLTLARGRHNAADVSLGVDTGI